MSFWTLCDCGTPRVRGQHCKLCARQTDRDMDRLLGDTGANWRTRAEDEYAYADRSHGVVYDPEYQGHVWTAEISAATEWDGIAAGIVAAHLDFSRYDPPGPSADVTLPPAVVKYGAWYVLSDEDVYRWTGDLRELIVNSLHVLHRTLVRTVYGEGGIRQTSPYELRVRRTDDFCAWLFQESVRACPGIQVWTQADIDRERDEQEARVAAVLADPLIAPLLDRERYVQDRMNETMEMIQTQVTATLQPYIFPTGPILEA